MSKAVNLEFIFTSLPYNFRSLDVRYISSGEAALRPAGRRDFLVCLTVEIFPMAFWGGTCASDLFHDFGKGAGSNKKLTGRTPASWDNFVVTEGLTRVTFPGD